MKCSLSLRCHVEIHRRKDGKNVVSLLHWSGIKLVKQKKPTPRKEIQGMKANTALKRARVILGVSPLIWHDLLRD